MKVLSKLLRSVQTEVILRMAVKITWYMSLAPQLGHRRWVHSRDVENPYGAFITFSPDSKCVASGTRDGYIYLWDVKNGENLHVIRVCHREVDSIAFSPDGSVSFLVQLMVSFEPGMSG